MSRPIPADIRRAVIDDAVAGVPRSRTAKKYGIAQSSCRRIAYEAGVFVDTNTMPADVRQAAIDDFLAGSTMQEAANKNGVGRSTLASWLDAAGLGAEDQEDGSSPNVYTAGWVLRGGIKLPVKPVRRKAA